MSVAARENILTKIRQSLNKKTSVPFPNRNNGEFVFQSPTQELEIEFAQNFTKLQGKFSFCESRQELLQQITELLQAKNWTKIVCCEEELLQILNTNIFATAATTHVKTCDVSITSCDALVARTGSILLTNSTTSGRATSVYAPIHICIAFTKQLVYDIGDGLNFLQKKYGKNLPSVISLATGPSRTADIEKTLVVGVHGPKEVYCFLVDE